MESLGKEARDKQVEEALKDVGNVKATEPLDQNGNVSRSPQKETKVNEIIFIM